MCAAKIKGKLTLTVHKAKELSDKQIIGKQDPYVVIVIGDEQFKTKTHHGGGTAAEWEQSFLFNLNIKDFNLNDDGAVHIKVWDKEVLLDRVIGRCDPMIMDMIKQKGPQWYTLIDKDNFKKVAGHIQITAVFEGTGAPIPQSPHSQQTPLSPQHQQQQQQRLPQQPQVQPQQFQSPHAQPFSPHHIQAHPHQFHPQSQSQPQPQFQPHHTPQQPMIYAQPPMMQPMQPQPMYYAAAPQGQGAIVVQAPPPQVLVSPVHQQVYQAPPAFAPHGAPAPAPGPTPAPASVSATPGGAKPQWACKACTYWNGGFRTSCEICATPH